MRLKTIELEKERDRLLQERALFPEFKAALEESELRYRTIFEHATDGFSVFQRFEGSLQRRLVDCNESYARMAGRDREELLELGDPRPVQKYDLTIEQYWQVQKLIEQGEPYEGAFSWQRPDGKENHIEYRAVPVRIGDGIYVYCIDRDVTERVLAEKARRESEETARALLLAASDVMYLLDRNFRILDLNEPATLFFGAPQQELAGRGLDELVRPKAAGRHLELAREVVLAGVALEAEDESEGRIYLFRVNPIANEKGEIRRLACFIRDVTAERRSEEQFIEYQEHLRRLAMELSAAESRERRRTASELHDHVGQSLFLSGMKVDELRNCARNPELRQSLEEIACYIQQAMEGARNLLMEMNPPSLSVLGLDAALSDLADQVSKKHGLRVRVKARGKVPPMCDDLKDLVFRGIRELVFNAVKHARASRVDIELKWESDRLKATIKDDGIGFDVDEALEINRQNKHFGLFSLRERLLPLGGRLDLESSRGRGARAVISLSLRPEKGRGFHHDD